VNCFDQSNAACNDSQGLRRHRADQTNQACERMLKGDVKDRLVVDHASLVH
jgi:D-arabinose 1-dehydrogenase-like Zn-dependent alcohol dehydrogenase